MTRKSREPNEAASPAPPTLPTAPPSPEPTYRDLDLTKVGEALRRQLSGAVRLVETFEKAKEVSQESLDFEVCL